MDLRTGFASIDRIRPGQRAPFFARRLAPSSTARDQSIIPRPPSSSSTARCSRRHKPAWVHSVNRRCAVGTVTPKLGGKCRHAQPLVSTNTIAVNNARSSTRDIPPPCGRLFAGGINGSTKAHNSSGTNRRDSSSTTARDHDRENIMIQMRHALSRRWVRRGCGVGWEAPAAQRRDSTLSIEWRTSPVWLMVKPMNTPIANRGSSRLVSAPMTISSSADRMLSAATP